MLLLANCLTVSTASIGINLGPTYLTSAYATDGKSGFTVVSVEGSEEYRKYFTDVLETQAAGSGTVKNSDASTQEIFRDALTVIKAVTEKKVGHKVNIGIISQPLYFNLTTSTALTDAAKEVQTGQAGQLTRFTNAARLAYGLNSCRGFGMNTSTCDIEQGEHSVIVVDYNKEYLEVAIAYVKGEYYSVRGYKRVKELGEDHRPSSSYSEDVQKVFQEFRGAYFATFDFWDYGAHVRAVVLSGDASKGGMDEMRRSLAQAWPEQYKNRFKDSIDPLYVGAAGAARMGQIEALRDLGTTQATGYEEEEDDDNEYDHDEL